MSDDTVTMPVDAFYHLQEQASNFTPATTGQRIAGTAQALIVLSAVAAVVPIGGWAWTRCQNWLDEKRYARSTRKSTNLSAVQ